MHRDTKLGLALGILLIGIVGALFFRHDADPEADVPQLDDPHTLDEQIAEQPIAPYLTGIETEAPATKDESESVSERTSPTSDPRAIPDPIAPQGEGQAGSPFQEVSVSQPNESWKHNEDWTPLSEKPTDEREKATGGSSSSTASAKPVSSSEESTTQDDSPRTGIRGQKPGFSEKTEFLRRYRVQPGDTLSELAARFLGSSAKYREIFELNRDVMKAPGDLRAGMTIRIPIENGSSSTGQAGPTGQRTDRTSNGATNPGATGGSSARDSQAALVGKRPAVPERHPISAEKPKDVEQPVGSPSKTDTEERLKRTEDEPRRRFVPVRRFPFVPRRDPVSRSPASNGG